MPWPRRGVSFSVFRGPAKSGGISCFSFWLPFKAPPKEGGAQPKRTPEECFFCFGTRNGQRNGEDSGNQALEFGASNSSPGSSLGSLQPAFSDSESFNFSEGAIPPKGASLKRQIPTRQLDKDGLQSPDRFLARIHGWPFWDTHHPIHFHLLKKMFYFLFFFLGFYYYWESFFFFFFFFQGTYVEGCSYLYQRLRIWDRSHPRN